MSAPFLRSMVKQVRWNLWGVDLQVQLFSHPVQDVVHRISVCLPAPLGQDQIRYPTCRYIKPLSTASLCLKHSFYGFIQWSIFFYYQLILLYFLIYIHKKKPTIQLVSHQVGYKFITNRSEIQSMLKGLSNRRLNNYPVLIYYNIILIKYWYRYEIFMNYTWITT